jgi:hypothetical protein
MQEMLSAQIEALPTLDKAQLLVLWAENFSKDPPPNLRKELMVPVLAYRILDWKQQRATMNWRRVMRWLP